MSDLVSQNLNMIFKTPKGETVHALKDVSFTLKKGELLTVLGPSGCGKTTLLNITAGFLRPTSGKITLNNNEIDGPGVCLLYTSPSPRDRSLSRMPSSA